MNGAEVKLTKEDILNDMAAVLKLPKKEVDKYERVMMSEKNQVSWMTEVAKFSAGDSFGELALINDDKRAATVSCLTNCNFAVINRENYQRVLKTIELRAV